MTCLFVEQIAYINEFQEAFLQYFEIILEGFPGIVKNEQPNRPYIKLYGNGNIINAQKISVPTNITSITPYDFLCVLQYVALIIC